MGVSTSTCYPAVGLESAFSGLRLGTAVDRIAELERHSVRAV